MKSKLQKAKKIKNEKGYIGLAQKVFRHIKFKVTRIKKERWEGLIECILNNWKVEYRYGEENLVVKTDSLRQYKYFKNKKISNGVLEGERVKMEELKISESCDAIFDVGAYMGLYLVLISLLNNIKSTRLLAFEPGKQNRHCLTDILGKNNISAEVRSEVVTGKDGWVDFFENKSEPSISNSTYSSNTDDISKSSKKSTSISKICSKNNYESIFLKIDAEGEEYEILKDVLGCSDYPKHIFGIVEVHEAKMGEDIEDIENILKENNYNYQVRELKYKYVVVMSNM